MESEETTALLERARNGSADALDALYRRCAGKLQGLVRARMGRSLRSRVESDDILQACLLKSLQKLPDFRGDCGPSLMAWLARICENEIRDEADRQGRQLRDVRQEVALDPAVHDAATRARSALSAVVLDERLRQLDEAIASLSPEHREVILLRRFEELPWSEVAMRLERSEDACRMLLARAMTALTLELEVHE